MKKVLFTILLLALGALGLQAQVQLKGKVLDQSTQEPLIGASIVLKGSTKGALTQNDGSFAITAENESQVLTVSYLGYKALELSVATVQANSTILLAQADYTTDAVVVTALGIKRDAKSLGYSSQNVDNEELDAVRSANPFNALKGKVAGLQVNATSNGLASSSRIVIRGENSLNINDNSPLIILDGTPINNDIYGVGGFSTNQADLPTDYGNAALDINPDDIASINVLKGAAASALYGSRGGNGVIIITTKSGEGQKKLGVSFSTNTSFSSPLRLPEIQTVYGGGWGQSYFADFGTNFGPAFSEGLSFPQDGHPGFAQGEDVPFIQRYDMMDFFQTGISSTNNVAISAAHDKGNFRLSYSNSYKEGIVPNTNLQRNNVSLNSSFNITDKWKVDVVGTYIRSGSDNLPVAGYGNQGVMYNLLWNYNNVDLDWLKDYWVEEDVQQNKLFSWGDNPFMLINEALNGFEKDRIFGNIKTSYQITDELSAFVRVGRDNFDDIRTSRRPWSAVRYPNGMYREQAISFTEDNLDFLLTYNKRFNENFSAVISAGGNQMTQSINESTIQGNGLAIPGIYTLGNINVQPSLTRFNSVRRINSLYAFANIGYKDFIYLDLTARNDWSSTLPEDNNSYFYPSASLSVILSEILDMGEATDYLKIRANAAQVGLDTDPYRLRKTYAFGSLPNSVTNQTVLPNSNLKPVTNTSFEVGIQGMFFKGRVSTDIAAYQTLSRDQIIQADISQSSGFNSIIVNAGEIATTGLEISANLIPLRTKNFEWSVGGNFTMFRSRVNELYQDLETFIIAQGPGGATVEARPGGLLGDIYGTVFLRSPNEEIIFTDNGLPALDPNRAKIGNYNPDFLLGLNTRLSWKGISAYALFNIRQGGYIYSYTNAIGSESGLLSHSLEGHEDGLIGDGVMVDADGNFVPNTNVASAEAWYYGGFYNRANVEANGFDASFVKLKEVSLSYTLPRNMVSKIGLGDLTVALTGNNVALWTKVPHIDPEAQAMNGGTLVPGFEVTQLPSVRQLGFRVNVGF
ncbi:MAG: SusC/RagA family TonB-linked outer membrane protein [Bacteroidota bacterium]